MNNALRSLSAIFTICISLFPVALYGGVLGVTITVVLFFTGLMLFVRAMEKNSALWNVVMIYGTFFGTMATIIVLWTWGI
jgi:hypothetical protein